MKKWIRPKHYIGAEWPDYYVFLSRNRDSDAMERSNFETALSLLGGETGEDGARRGYVILGFNVSLQ